MPTGALRMAALAQWTALGSDAIRRGVAWWLGELRALLPWRVAGRAERAPAILEVSPDRATLVLAKRGSAQVQELPLRGVDPAEARRRVQSALRARGIGDAVIIRLDPSLLLRSGVTLPLAAERSLRPILQNQLERLVPLPAAEVFFEYRVLSRSPAAKTLNVELVTATRTSIDEAVALATSAGLVPSLAIASGGAAGNEAALVLWRASRQEESLRERRLKRGLELAAALLLVIAYGAYVYRLDERRDELQTEVAQATKQAAIARAQVQQQTATQSALALLERRRKEPSPLALLNELTALIPSSAWISQLTLQKRNIEIIGYSPRVSDFVPRINNSDSFWNLKFRSPIALSPDGKGERFDISFDVYVEDTP
jgi:general secretion pathway protein L